MNVVPPRAVKQTAIQTQLGAVFASLELSRSTWLVTSLWPGCGETMSKHSVCAGDVAGLLKRFSSLTEKARTRTGQTFPLIAIQEVGLVWAEAVTGPPQPRGFDDDDFSPPIRRGPFGESSARSTKTPLPLPSGSAVSAIVKWFNAEKGFGFVEASDGSGDAFLGAAVLNRAGRQEVSPRTTFQVRRAPGQKG